MNSHNDPGRMATSAQATTLKGRQFSFLFLPFSVTMLELRLEHAISGR
jgi:hypothetical protein